MRLFKRKIGKFLDLDGEIRKFDEESFFGKKYTFCFFKKGNFNKLKGGKCAGGSRPSVYIHSTAVDVENETIHSVPTEMTKNLRSENVTNRLKSS